ncbi:hypothetical protein TIFTF001_035837 [Ficus carica]|uniref:Uncharacterized protein n=1 Tax=Ficus carica TaxID=3494 RepID=A0AA88E5P4_FICCA|nr:hypothetical protein TIFTF001_035837 [Ficus carica]
MALLDTGVRDDHARMPRLVQVTTEQAQIPEEDATKACDLNSDDRDSEGAQVLAVVHLFVAAVIARLCSLSPLASIASTFSLISSFSCFGHETRDRSILSLSSPAFAALIGLAPDRSTPNHSDQPFLALDFG